MNTSSRRDIAVTADCLRLLQHIGHYTIACTACKLYHDHDVSVVTRVDQLLHDPVLCLLYNLSIKACKSPLTHDFNVFANYKTLLLYRICTIYLHSFTSHRYFIVANH